MGYKRKARVLFLSSGNGSRCLMAACFANQFGANWLEGQPAVFKKHDFDSLAVEVMHESGVEWGGGNPGEVNEALLKWADLVVLMDPEAEQCCPPLPQGVQKRSYFFDDPAGKVGTAENLKENYRKVRDQIRQRVEGMIGGIKMLQKASD